MQTNCFWPYVSNLAGSFSKEKWEMENAILPFEKVPVRFETWGQKQLFCILKGIRLVMLEKLLTLFELRYTLKNKPVTV